MGELVYRSQVRVERIWGPVRKAFLPAEKEPVIFGAHGAIAEHYGLAPEAFPAHATTIDYIVASTAG